MEKKTRERLLAHGAAYPGLQVQDVCKYLYQSAFGCEHMAVSLDGALERLREEWETGTPIPAASIDPLDGDYSRVHLGILHTGLSLETLSKLFVLSAKKEPEGQAQLLRKLAVAGELVKEGSLPFSAAAFDAALSRWAEEGYPPVHHSEAFRAAYAPKYRVIANRYLPFLPLFAKIDKILQKGTLVLAIEGGSASGKTTLSGILEQLYGCTVFHVDDFFLRPEQRTKERLKEPGGNMDRERFLEEVLLPLQKKEPVFYRRFDCGTQEIMPPVCIRPGRFTVIEGAYAMHPMLAGYYDFSVFLDVSGELQKERIAKRNPPPVAKRFYEEWIPLEHLYFSKLQVRERCSMCIQIPE